MGELVKKVVYTLLFLLFLVAFAIWLWPINFNPEARKYIFIVGAIAAWRYTLFIINALRAIFYKKYYYPKIEERAKKLGKENLPEEVFIIVTTFRIPENISVEVYRNAIKEIVNCAKSGIRATLIASVVEKSEENLVKSVWKVIDPPENAKLIITRFAGTGKRDGLAVAFRVLTKEARNLKRAVVALVDGDTILTENSVKATLPLFAYYKNLGAVTTNEDCVLEEKNFTYKLYKIWYRLRFAQRDTYMASASLSWRVQTLTGRMSVFRGELFLDPEFIKTVQYDFFEHWRIGWLRFLTGDDKSTWFYVLKNGWDMLYIPNVMVWTHEYPPSDSFIKGATMLMVRWFGNSLRATYRAMKIPMKITRPHMWYLIRDQRITMWTGLYGLVGSVLGAIKWGGDIFLAYIWWVLFTRFLMVLYYAFQRNDFFVSWVPLLYFNQIYGSLVKIYISSHLYRQKWTRQKTVLAGKESKLDRIYVEASSHLELYTKVLLFLIITGFLIGFFDRYDIINLTQIILPK